MRSTEWNSEAPPGPTVIGIAGLGSIGLQHARAFGSLRGVTCLGFDVDEAARAHAIAAGLVAQAYPSLEELLEQSLTGLVIASPDHVHLEQLRAANAAGVSALVEKPLAPTHEVAEGLTAPDALQVPVLVGYVLRHRKVLQLAHDLLRRDAIGTVASFQVMLGAYGTIEAAVDRFRTPEDDRLYRDYSHEWDYLRWLLAPVARVTAVARTVEGPSHVESPNVVDALLELDNGIVGGLHIDYFEPRGTRTLHLVGHRGSMHVDVPSGSVTLRVAGEDSERHFSVLEPPSGPLTRQAEHFLEVAGGRSQPAVDVGEGVAALAVADALIRSAASRTWVAVRDA